MNYLAIDIGASSGRHIVATTCDGQIKYDEVYRFDDYLVNQSGSLVWNIEKLTQAVICGICEAFKKYDKIESLAIDTWGVDYVLLDGEKPILPVYAYRDRRTQRVVKKVHDLISFEKLYEKTGIQFQPFNTIYQLFADKESGRLQNATSFLMLPEYFTYVLTGKKVHEYTNATTTGLLNATTGEYDKEIIESLNLPKHLFTKTSKPSTFVGELTSEIQARVGGNLKVLLCASHDTASAVEGIEMDDENPYISSGTWSLLGLKVKDAITNECSRRTNYSNEGGCGYIRYQKNIMGMWVINELRRCLCPNTPFSKLVEMAKESDFERIVDVNDNAFLSTRNMAEAFDNYLGYSIGEEKDYFKCAMVSLAYSYKVALDELSKNTGRSFSKLYIVGGGAKNSYLNALTEEICNIQVIAYPFEVTAIGNIKKQLEGKYD